jgi:septal ring factor EnvC (AmiA/AmiB activator)
MDIAGTKKKIQRVSKLAEESYKKMNQLLEQVQTMQEDLETTSEQVNHIEYDIAEQRAILDALAAQQGLDVDQLLEDADLPPEPGTETEDETQEETQDEAPEMATSRPSTEDSE